MVNRYLNSALRTKVVISMTLIILIYSIIFSVMTISQAQEEKRVERETIYLEQVNQFNSYLDSLQTDLVNLSSLPYANRSVLTLLADPSAMEIANRDSSIHDFLLSTTLLKDTIDFAGLINETSLQSGYYVTTGGSYGLHDYSTLIKSSIFTDFIATGNDYGCYRLPTRDTSIIKQNISDKILFLRTVRNPHSNFDLSGYLLLGIDVRKFTNYCSAFLNSDTSGIVIYNQNEQVLYQNGLKLKSDYFLTNSSNLQVTYQTVQKDDYIFCSANANAFNWNILYYTNLNKQPSAKLSSSIYVILLVAVTAVAVFFIMAILVTTAVTLPLKRLHHSMQQFQAGDFTQSVAVTCNDEIGQLTQGYNQMVNQIEKLIEQNYTIKLREKESELAALQAQINPHFLYNTLDLLYWKSIASNQDEVARMVYSLAKLFRLSLNKGDSFISLEKEKNFLLHYLSLQSSLMSNKLTYNLLLPDAMSAYCIPRFILQPFIENSIVHGFKDFINPPIIDIQFTEYKEQIKITLQDNGCGIPPELLSHFFSGIPLEIPYTGNGYAIPNVLDRLNIYFDKSYSVNVVSTPGKGTLIILILPKSRNK